MKFRHSVLNFVEAWLRQKRLGREGWLDIPTMDEMIEELTDRRGWKVVHTYEAPRDLAHAKIVYDDDCPPGTVHALDPKFMHVDRVIDAPAEFGGEV